MRKCIVALILLSSLLACNNKKVSLEGDEKVEQTDFISAFPKSELPFTVADTGLQRLKTSTPISYTIFNQFVPDSILNDPFGKNRKVNINPIARFENEQKETYLVTHISSGKKEAVYLLVFDNKNAYSASLPLINPISSLPGVTTASIDKKEIISINTDWKTDNVNYYQRNIYAYNNAGKIMLVLQETNDNKNADKEINPLDTFPKKNKFSGDYYKGKNNLVAIRDGINENAYKFYIYFQNDDEEKCGGELRGEFTLTSPTTAMFKESGNTCVIDFTLTPTQVKVKEQGSCGNYRGIKCFFNDTYTKKKEPKTPKKKK